MWVLLRVGFEPTHLTVLELESSALDHSAIWALLYCLLLFAIILILLYEDIILLVFHPMGVSNPQPQDTFTNNLA